jgi:methylenetetrahydrofolate--tRNA-(uracil-5-)-methyltransferase
LRLKSRPNLRFAGQITGVEGYVESAAIGLMAGRMIAAEFHDEEFAPPPPETAHGALLNHITGGAESDSFQPMNINFGLFALPPEDQMVQITANGKKRKLKGADRKSVLARRALTAMASWSGQKAFH